MPLLGTHPRINKATDGQAFISNLTVHLRQTPQVVSPPSRRGSAPRSSVPASPAPTLGSATCCPQLIGASRAADLIFSGCEIGAVTAERMGLVSQVVLDDELSGAALGYAEMIAAHSNIGLTLTKDVLWQASTSSLPAAIAMENRNQSIAMHSPEVRERMASYSQHVRT